MTDTLQVILKIGKKRRVVAGAMDWPGLDRCGTSEDGDWRSGAPYRGRGFGPVAVTRRCGTQSSTWTKPSNVAPWRTRTSCSERR